MFPLISNAVSLETEEETEPVYEVHGVVPLVERRFAEVPGGAQGGGRGAYLWEAEGGVVGEEAVNWNDVERLQRQVWRRRATAARWWRSLPQIHGM